MLQRPGAPHSKILTQWLLCSQATTAANIPDPEIEAEIFHEESTTTILADIASFIRLRLSEDVMILTVINVSVTGGTPTRGITERIPTG
jgi:hypothetical protein